MKRSQRKKKTLRTGKGKEEGSEMQEVGVRQGGGAGTKRKLTVESQGGEKRKNYVFE